jgi:glycosyltransferase involved in cell wall biosynthesis
MSTAMRVMHIHNRYQLRGGEETSVESERRMLGNQGQHVIPYDRDSREIQAWGATAKARLFFSTTWSGTSYRDIERLVRKEKPDVAHVRNVQPLLSPSIYWALDRAGVPIVQTLDNFRLFCPATTFLRDGRICEECRDYSLLRSVRYACFRDSRIQSLAVAQSLWLHRLLGTWSRCISLYIALTEFGRFKFVQSGLPPGRIEVKPHFLESPPVPEWDHDGYALFVGRLSAEKGVLTLLRAWRGLPHVPLRIVGDGPLRIEIETRLKRNGLENVVMLGEKPLEECLRLMRRARFIVFPSEWFEGLPRVIVEAYACGKPVVASRLGAMSEVIIDGRTGLHFRAGDSKDLAEKVNWLIDHDVETRQMGREARSEFESNYTEERNFELLMRIYERAIGMNRNK